MDASVGSASAMQINYFPGHQSEATLNLTLNSAVVLLALPTTEVSAIVADNQFDVSKVERHRPRVQND
jgi:hypothetical protein